MSRILLAAVIAALFAPSVANAQEALWSKPTGYPGEMIVATSLASGTRVDLVRGKTRLVLGTTGATSVHVDFRDLDGDRTRELVWRDDFEDGPGGLYIYRRTAAGYERAFASPHYNPEFAYHAAGAQTHILFPAPGRLLPALINAIHGGLNPDDYPVGVVMPAGEKFALRPLSCSPAASALLDREAGRLDMFLQAAVKHPSRSYVRQGFPVSGGDVRELIKRLAVVQSSISKPCPKSN